MPLQLVYKHLEEQAATEETGASDAAAEEESLLHGGNQDYPQQLSYAIDNLHESSVISICCWPGSSSRVFTGSGATSTEKSSTDAVYPRLPHNVCIPSFKSFT